LAGRLEFDTAASKVHARFIIMQAKRSRGKLTEYRGEGYCYHSLLRPVAWTVPGASNEVAPLTVEAKPRTGREPRLKDAIFTLAELPSDVTGFTRIPFAPRVKTCEATSAQFSSSWDDEDNDDERDWRPVLERRS
jgi:hypothetical protein